MANYCFSLFGGMDFFTILLLICMASSESSIGNSFNVIDFGAVGDGKTDDSKAFLEAWTATCGDGSTSPTLQIPSGKLFLLKPLEFRGPCKSNTVIVEVLGNVVAPNVISAWGSSVYAWISFDSVNGLTIEGSGQIDGQGSAWWQGRCQYDEGYETNCPPRPTALDISHCDGLQLSGFQMINSPRNHISIFSCNRVTISKLHIKAPQDSPNTDGINIGNSTLVHVEDCDIASGDDCISVLGSSSNINITHIGCGPGHGISIGSLGANGAHEVVEEVHISNVVFTGTMNGVRIKTWQGGSGYARKISFDNITFSEVENPLIIDQFYCPNAKCQNHTSAVAVSDVTYSGLQGSSLTETAIQLSCSQNVACTSIVINQINITSADPKKETTSYCFNAHGSASDSVPAVPCLLKQS